jgi:hypothetical protein
MLQKMRVPGEQSEARFEPGLQEGVKTKAQSASGTGAGLNGQTPPLRSADNQGQPL